MLCVVVPSAWIVVACCAPSVDACVAIVAYCSTSSSCVLLCAQWCLLCLTWIVEPGLFVTAPLPWKVQAPYCALVIDTVLLSYWALPVVDTVLTQGPCSNQLYMYCWCTLYTRYHRVLYQLFQLFQHIYLSIYLSIYPSTCLSVCLSIYLSISNFILLLQMNGLFPMNFVSLVQDVESSRPATNPIVISRLALSFLTHQRRWLYFSYASIMEYHRTYQNDPLKLFGIAAVLEHLNRGKTKYDQILFCRPLPHQDRDSRYHLGEESVFFKSIHIISSNFSWCDLKERWLINHTVRSLSGSQCQHHAICI